ncbi:hypothetical protein ABZS29_13545 [Kribbella sp. NPDC005582]|uniref:M16 family metallopeptidase n=1 Tax=Kribbella sp. NPDC005582 TaxID=3156893 RepID=UPI0033B4F0AB
MPEYVDGVRVLHRPGNQKHTEITLTFAVGARDETLRTIGVAHALEHLVMGTVRRIPIEINAEVDAMTTSFTASGSPARVGEFLEQLCRSLTAPPVDRLALEAGILAAEDGQAAHPVVAYLMYALHGAQGPGLLWLEGPGYDGLTGDHVVAFARRWFVASNAVLEVTGPLPENLRLPLDPGPAPARPDFPRRVFDGPAVIEGGIPAAGLAVTLPMDDSARRSALTMYVLGERIEEQCRHVGGHSYVVGGDLMIRPDGSGDYVVYAEARDGSEEAVARIVVEALRDLAAHGPTESELSFQIDRWLERMEAEPEQLQAERNNAIGALFGLPTLDPVDVDALRKVSPQDIAAVLTAALPTAIGYTFDDTSGVWQESGFGLTPPCPVLTELPAGKVFKPPLFARAFFKEARGMQWVQTADGLVLRDEDGIHEVRWDSIAGVQRGTDESPTIVYGVNGCAMPVDTDLFRGADDVLAELQRRVPASLWFDESKLGPADD